MKALPIRENKIYGIFVEGLAEYIVENENDCFILLAKGDLNRIVRQTKLNHHSSRSHTIFQMLIEKDTVNKRGVLKKGKINFCDLAGSEKYDKDNTMTQVHIKEMTQINKSLTCLGKVIHELGRKNSAHVPYRDSKLTRLLQDSLGLTTRTILIATISPSAYCIEETINTLKFANRAKEIMVKAKKNEISALNDELVMKLQREIQHLKGLLNLKRGGGIQELQHQLLRLKEENNKLKKITSIITVEEVERLKQENKRLRIELQNIGSVKESGDPFIADNSSVNSSDMNMCLSELSPKKIEFDRPEVVSPALDVSPIPSKNYNALNGSQLVSSPTMTSIGAKSTKYLKPFASSLDIHKKLNARYKINNHIIMDNELENDLKESENKKKNYNLARARLERITQIERTKKQKFKEDLEKLVEEKKKEENLKKKKSIKKMQTESLQELFVRKKEKILRGLGMKID